MTLIEVEEKDAEKVFEILATNGQFTGLARTLFRIDENAEHTLKKIRDAGIRVKVTDEAKQ